MRAIIVPPIGKTTSVRELTKLGVQDITPMSNAFIGFIPNNHVREKLDRNGFDVRELVTIIN